MTLRTQQFVEKMLTRAEYEFDDSVKEWAGWIKGFPGIYAQARNIETLRRELAEMIEEYLFLSFQQKKPVKGFDIRILSHAKTN